ncbi:MAG TPA: flagellar protein FlgN [Noviherbaspirillum sp.]|nr:flagellar protein FlgN [Noviherbaspirillum sp.]
MQAFASTPAQTLSEELAAARALLKLLNDEQELLVQADVDGLNRALEEKGSLVAKMGELAMRRYRHLTDAGFDGSEAGMQSWLNSRKPAGTAQQDWAALLELARQGKELNRTNGMLIGQHMARTQSALNVLQGAPEGGQMYGPNGQATTAAGGRRLVVG